MVFSYRENMWKGTTLYLDPHELTFDLAHVTSTIFLQVCFHPSLSYSTRTKSWLEAMHWYEEAVNTEKVDEDGHYDSTMDDPNYLLSAKMAEMYRSGGPDLDKNPEKAGKLSPFFEAEERHVKNIYHCSFY